MEDDLIINHCGWQMSDERRNQLAASGAIQNIPGSTDWQLREDHTFSYQEVRWLMDIDGEGSTP